MFKPRYKAYREWRYIPKQDLRWYWCVKKRIPIIGIWRTIAFGWTDDLSTAEINGFETKRSLEQEYESSLRLKNKEIELKDYERSHFIKNVSNQPSPFFPGQPDAEPTPDPYQHQHDTSPDVLPIQTADQAEIG